jgi:hypothetical protein
MARHPGFDLRQATIHDFMGTQVDGVHWLNFLGQPVLGGLGGVGGLHHRLQSRTTTVQELQGERAVVTLGPRPKAGDLFLGETLTEYSELARVLEPWLEPFDPDFILRSRHTDDATELRRWWHRFID